MDSKMFEIISLSLVVSIAIVLIVKLLEKTILLLLKPIRKYKEKARK